MMIYIIGGIVFVTIILLCIGLAIASFAAENFQTKLEELDQKRNSYGLSTMDYVVMINRSHFNSQLKIARCAEYNDHYSTGVVALSDQTMGSNSLASIAIVSHELGHARQDNEGDKLKKHWRMRTRGRICGLFFMPLIVLGVVLNILYLFEIIQNVVMVYVGCGMFGLAGLIFLFAIFLKYKEVQVEKEASKYAIEYISQFLTKPEIKMCEEFLDSARLTYWSVLFKTMLGWTFLTKRDKMFR